MKQKRQLDDSPLRLAQIARLKNVSDDYSHLGQDYILSHITTNTSYFYAPVARRFDGHTMIIGVKGTIKITIDLDTVEVPPNSVVFVAPERVFKPIDWEGEELDGYLLFLSNKFVYDLNIDLNAINTNIFTSAKAVLTLSPERCRSLSVISSCCIAMPPSRIPITVTSHVRLCRLRLTRLWHMVKRPRQGPVC